MRRLLMVAYHFPPVAGSSGMQRTLRFVQHLPAHGWEPMVLTISPRAYERTSPDLLGDIPDGMVVRRAFGLDAASHLSLFGRYFRATALPDRWASWRLFGVPEGMKMIREFKPDALWSTFPIATAQLIGAILHGKSGLPWVADFRDPMTKEDYPPDPVVRRSYRRVEETVIRNASRSTFTTQGTQRTYQQRFPEVADRMFLVENGYDEASFAGLENGDARPLVPGSTVLLHSGIVYPLERAPRALFMALQRLKESGRIREGSLLLRFRAAQHEELLRNLAREHGVESLVEICPPVPYREALAEMVRADGLLALQSANCNAQIPAKIYEYLRANRPILCLADPAGETAGVVRAAGLDSIAPLESADAIESLLPRFLDSVKAGRARLPDAAVVMQSSREGRTEILAKLLDEVCSKPA